MFEVYRSAVDVWLLFYLSSIFQTSFFNFLFGLTQVPKSLYSKLKIYWFFQFGRILSCLLLLSLQSVEKEVLEKINIGLISLTIAGVGFEVILRIYKPIIILQ